LALASRLTPSASAGARTNTVGPSAGWYYLARSFQSARCAAEDSCPRPDLHCFLQKMGRIRAACEALGFASSAVIVAQPSKDVLTCLLKSPDLFRPRGFEGGRARVPRYPGAPSRAATARLGEATLRYLPRRRPGLRRGC